MFFQEVMLCSCGIKVVLHNPTCSIVELNWSICYNVLFHSKMSSVKGYTHTEQQVLTDDDAEDGGPGGLTFM